MQTMTEKKTNLSGYTAGEYELSNKQLKTAAWLVRNRRNLYITRVVFLVLFCVATVGYSTIQWGEYLIFGFFDDRAMFEQQLREIENYERLHPIYGARPIEVIRSTVLRAGNNKYDFVTEVVNPNDRWVARVRYKYVYSGGETKESSAVILPGQIHLLPIFGFERSSFPAQGRLVIVDTTWASIPAKRVPDAPGYIAERINFLLEDVSYGLTRTDGAPANSVFFRLHNASAYSYWQADFLVAFFDRGSMVAVRPLVLDEFLSEERREVDFRLTGSTDRVSEVEVIPVINVFDTSIFIDPAA